MTIPKHHPVQILFDKTKYVTTYMTTFLDCHHINEALPEPKDLSYPARSLWSTLQNIHYSGEMPFGEIWSLETLRIIVLSDRENIEEELEENNGDLVNVTIQQMDGDEFLDYYFDHSPTREDLLNYIATMLEVELETGDVGQEQPLMELMNGLFSFGQHGNIQYLADEDWQLLAQAVGLPENAEHDKITTLLQAEQKHSAVELLTKGYDEVVRGVSIVGMITPK